jgi:hypothetical protein
MKITGCYNEQICHNIGIKTGSMTGYITYIKQCNANVVAESLWHSKTFLKVFGGSRGRRMS